MPAEKKLPLQTSTNANVAAAAAPPRSKAGAGKTIEETYQKKSQLEHILLRPDTYIGSIEKHTQTLWIWEERMVQKSISYVPGLYKIFDEILVNAADNKQRDPSMNSVKVVIDVEQNLISVYNNGDGVPVEIHQEEGVYVPEMIFGHLLTSSNYDDTVKKTVGGRNGYGAKLTNIFSTEFVIETADGKRLKKYKQVFSNNMGKKSEPHITNCKEGENWTKVTFKPDLAKFNMTHLEDDVVSLMQKRVIDIAGCLGKSVKVELNGQKIPVKSFSDYADLYLDSASKFKEEPLPKIHAKVNDRWEVCISLSEGQFQQVSFVNGIATIKGGTHVDYVTNQIANYILSAVINKKKKNATNLKAHVVKNHLWVFVNAMIDNPAFDSQTKETLTIRQTSFGSKCELPEDFLKKVVHKSFGIVETLLSWAEIKEKAELKKTDGTKRGRISGLAKLEDANDAGGKNSHKCTLILTEGDSAKALAMSGISVVGRNHYGVFPLRGKLLNVREANHKQIMDNAEIQNLKKILGLQHGKDYGDVKSLRYGHLMIMTDQDHDGSHIKGLLINFIHTFWPSLLKVPSFLLEFITPIVKATNETTKKQIAFYSMPEYESWKESLNGSRGWTIKYYKGLGTSTSDEAREYFQDLERHKKDFIWVDEEDGNTIELAFSKKKIEARKNWLRQFEPGTYLDQTEKLIKYSDFVNKELILFSIADLQRSIPSMVDGLKPGQRKILFCAFKKNLTKKEEKVSEFSGYVSLESAYHHGEQSLYSTIVGMAQDFVGSNNINFLQPKGQFGTRHQGGKDHASARYIYTKLLPIARFLFPKADDILLDYMNEDGKKIEPTWYMPVIPTVLINGSEGIGTGWSSYVPNYNPRDLVANVRRLLKGEPIEPMDPWYKGFRGTIEKTSTKETGVSYTVCGVIEEIDETTLRITELPIRKWTQDYKEFLESIMTGNEKIKDPFIKDYREHNDDKTVHFEVILSEENLMIAKQEGLLKKFKLTTTISTSNMHLFDPKGVIKKYDTPEQILEEFYILRFEYYEKRKKAVLENLKLELLKLENKVRFILAVVAGEIIVSNRKKADLLIELKEKGFTPFPRKISVENKDDDDSEETEENEVAANTKTGVVKGSDYEYLLSMAIGSLTREKVQQLLEDKEKMIGDVDFYGKVTVETLWLQDLDALEKELDALDIKAEKDEVERKKTKGKVMNEAGLKASRQAPKIPRKNNTKKATASSSSNVQSVSETLATTTSSPMETDNAHAVVKPKGRPASKKPAAKKGGKSSLSLIDEDNDDDEVLELKDRLAAYNLGDSSPDTSDVIEAEVVAPKKKEPTKRAPTTRKKQLPTVTEISDSDEEKVENIVSDADADFELQLTKEKKKAAPKKRGPAASKPRAMGQRLITEVFPSKGNAGISPEKKVRRMRDSPFNKKSGSMLGKIGVVVGDSESEEEENVVASGSSLDSSRNSNDSEEVTVAASRAARPVRANRGKKTTYVLSDTDEEEEEEEDDSEDSEFDV